MLTMSVSFADIFSIVLFTHRRLLNIDDLLRKYHKESPKEISKSKKKIENSLVRFADVKDIEKDFITEVKLLKDYKEEVYHVHKVGFGLTVKIRIKSNENIGALHIFCIGRTIHF